MTTIGWDDMQDAAVVEDEPPPPSEYQVIVEAAEFKLNKDNKPQWKIRFKITAGPQKNKALWTWLTISTDNQMALRIVSQQFDMLGLPHSVRRELSGEEIADELVGAQCVVTTSMSEWQGEDRARIDKMKPAVDGSGRPAKGKNTKPEPPAKSKKTTKSSKDAPPKKGTDSVAEDIEVEGEYADDDDDMPTPPFED